LNNKIIKKYIRQVQRIYSGKRKNKKHFIQELHDALLCYCEEHPNSSYNDLLSEFGEPSELKNTLLFRSATELHKRNMVLYWAAISVITICVLGTLFFTIQYATDIYRFSHDGGYYVEMDWENENIPKEESVNPINGKPDPTPYKTITFE
jgi:hypothetical protein